MKKLQSVFLVLIGLVLIANMPVLAEEAVQGQPAPAVATPAAPVAAVAAPPPAGPDPTGATTLKANPEAPVDYVWVYGLWFSCYVHAGRLCNG